MKTDVTVLVYDPRGAHATYKFSINVLGGNHLPLLKAIPTQIKGAEGKPLQLTLTATDTDGNPLVLKVKG